MMACQSLSPLLCALLVSALAGTLVLAQSEGSTCDSSSDVHFPVPNDPQSYLFCGLTGRLRKWRCPEGQVYNNNTQACVNATAPQQEGIVQRDGVCSTGSPLLSNGQPQMCSTLFPSCPQGYNCQMGAQGLQTYYCCSAQTSQTSGCSGGLQPYMTPGTNQPQACSIFVASQGCPNGYSCQASATALGQYLCCGQPSNPTTQTGACPVNTTPYLFGNQPLTCSLQANTCPQGYSCQMSPSSFPQQYFCCSQSTAPTGVCTSANTYLQNGFPQFCTPSVASACPATYSCQQNPVGQYVCCSTGSSQPDSQGCPQGLTPYILPSTQQPQTCNPSSQSECPSTSLTGVRYNCMWSQLTFRYQCCGQASGGGLPSVPSCPASTSPLLNPQTQQPQACLPQASNCPQGYQCVLSSVPGTAICCSSSQASGGCPSNAQPLLLGGQPQPCSQFQQCPFGYQCTATTTGQQICCQASTSINSCPANSQQLLVGGVPQQCSQFQQCPSGSQCIQTATGQQICCQPTSTGGSCPMGYLSVNNQCRRLQCTLMDN